MSKRSKQFLYNVFSLPFREGFFCALKLVTELKNNKKYFKKYLTYVKYSDIIKSR
nr:MAG TPA: hypothetical protein [Caudoviricetes sp.]